METPFCRAARLRLLVLGGAAILPVVTSASLHLRAQRIPATPAAPTQASEPTFKLRVQKNVVIMRVVVRDSHGHTVAGLRKEDFKVFDNRKQQVISSFSAEAPAPVASSSMPPATTPRAKAAPGQEEAATPFEPLTYLALYFDDLNSAFDSVVRSRDAAEKFIAGLPPSERIAIFTSSGTQSLDFTDDRRKLQKALFRLQANIRLNPRMSCPEITDFLADQIVNREDPAAYHMVRDEAIGDCQMDPRSVPNEWIRMQAQAAYDAYVMQARSDLTNLDLVIQHIAMMPGERQVMLVSDGFMALEMRDRVGTVIDHALRLRVIVSALDGKGLAVQLREADASRSYAPSGDLAGLYHIYDTSREAAATGTLAEIADGTGGRFVHNSNDLLGGFRRALMPAEVSYVLTFSPQNLKENGAFHTLKVHLVEGHGMVIQARRGYFAPKKQLSPEEQARDQIRDAVFSQDPIRGLPLEIQTHFRRTGAQDADITVQAHLDVRTLPFQREDNRNINKITFTVALFDADGRFISGKQQNRDLDLKDTTLGGLQKSGLNFQAHVSVKTGTYTVRVVVRESQGAEMGALSKAVKIPD